MNKTVFAHTPPGADFPPYVNLSRQDGAAYTLTVRSKGNGGRDTAAIDLSPEALEALSSAALADLHQQPAVTDEMVSRFLSWKLPQDFSPDCYTSFDREAAGAGSWPTGTNLLNAIQARAMLEHILGVGPCEACR